MLFPGARVTMKLSSLVILARAVTLLICICCTNPVPQYITPFNVLLNLLSGIIKDSQILSLSEMAVVFLTSCGISAILVL